MAVTVLAKIKVKPGSEATVEAAFRDMIGKVRANEPGTQAYVLHKVDKDPTTFWFYEVYQDQAAFDSHGKTEHMKEMGGKLGGNLDGRPEIIILNELARK
jgi:quinol monooxygenase YgiN